MSSVQFPQLGETIVEGTILKWLKAEGEAIERDEPLFEISTDKVDTEVPSPYAGTLTKILVAEGATVAVGTDVAEIAAEGESPAAPAAPTNAEPAASVTPVTPVTPAAPAAPAAPVTPAAPAASLAPVSAPAVTPVAAGPRAGILSPLVRRLAAENGVDLSRVRGTGTGGRITKNDVLAAMAEGGAGVMPAVQTPSAAGVAAPALTPAPPVTAGAGEEVVPLSHIRQAIGAHMLTSTQTAARAWTMVEVNVDRLVRLRALAKDRFLATHGVKLTYLPFVVRATTDALLAHPEVNAELRGDQMVLRRYVNLGIAVSYDAGLIVPVIKGVDGMNSVGIARAVADLAARARSHDLKPDEVQGATFTITNPGPYGSLVSVPIINQPNTGILSLDGIQKRPVVVDDDAIAVRSMVYISMSWDHRVIDGELATRFLARIKQNLETWDFAEDLGL
jgi:pyruvate dehydrogenase E2 component (dihydrolipoamide acetyltransferase)